MSDHIRRHNTTRHSGTGQTPLERYLASNERVRRPVSREWLEEAFHNRVRVPISCMEAGIILCGLTDRVANGKTKRQATLSVDYTKEGTGDVY